MLCQVPAGTRTHQPSAHPFPKTICLSRLPSAPGHGQRRGAGTDPSLDELQGQCPRRRDRRLSESDNRFLALLGSHGEFDRARLNVKSSIRRIALLINSLICRVFRNGSSAVRAREKASMSRGVEVRGSEHFCLRHLRKLECAQDPGVPRALGTFRERRSASQYGVPGAAQRIRATERWLLLSFRGAVVRPLTRNP